MHSADCGTNHALVRCKLQITPKKFYQTRPKPLPLVDLSSPHDSLRNQRFQQLLSSKLDSATLPADPNIVWCTTRDVSSLCPVHSRSVVTDHRRSLTGFATTSTSFYSPLQTNDQPDEGNSEKQPFRSQGVAGCKAHRSTSRSFCSLALLGKPEHTHTAMRRLRWPSRTLQWNTGSHRPNSEESVPFTCSLRSTPGLRNWNVG